MQKYLGVKIIHAEPMTKSEFNTMQNRLSTADDTITNGYKVVYEDNYVSWSPKNTFEKAYRRIDNLNFGLAIEAMKKGFKVARKGWNGKGMYLYYVPANRYKCLTEIAKKDFGDSVQYKAYIAMKTVDGEVVPWLASQTDMLAEDWTIVE